MRPPWIIALGNDMYIRVSVCSRFLRKGKGEEGGRRRGKARGERRTDRFPVFDNVDSGGGTEEPEIPWR